MHKNKSKIFIVAGFIVTVVTLLIFFFITYSSFKSTITQTKDEKLVLRMMLKLDHLQTNLVDIEALERPHIIAENSEQMVQKFEMVKSDCEKEIAALQELTANKELPVTELDQLILLAKNKIAFAENIFSLSSHGKSMAAVESVIKNEDSVNIPLKDQYNKVSNIGRKLLNAFQENHDNNAKITFQLIGLFGLVAIIFLSFSFYKTLQDSKLINNISDELQNANNHLEQRVKEQTSKLQQALQQNNSLFENASDGIGIVNSSGKILRVNPAVEKMFGYTKEEIESMVLNDFLFEPELQNNPFTTANIPPKGFLQTIGKYKKKDGSKLYAEVHSSSLPDGTFMAIVRDITDRRKNEAELRMREYAMAKAMSGIGITDMTGTITYANDAIAKMWGADSANELIGKKLTDCFEGPRILQTITSLQEKGFDSGEDIGKRIDGSLFDVQFVANVIFDLKGRPVCMFGSFTDITEIKKQREEINTLADIIENSEAMVGTMDMNFNVTYVNKAARRAMEIGEKDDISNLDIFKSFAPEIITINEILEELRIKGIWQGENILLSKTGKKIPILQVILLHKNKAGDAAFISSNAIDLTELKEKQNAIFDERNLLIKLLDNLPGIFYMYNRNGEFYKWNKNFEELTEYSSIEISKMHPIDFYDEPEKEFIKNRIASVFKANAPSSIEIKVLIKSKKKIPLLINSWLIDYHGEQVLVGVGLNLTELKQKEIALQTLGSLVEESAAIVGTIDLKGNMLYANKVLKAKMEIDATEDITKYNINNFRTEKGKQTILKIYEELAAKGSWMGENYYHSKSGKEYTLLQVMLLHKTPEGLPHTISTTAIDITNIKKKENELKKLENVITHANTFVAITDIRTHKIVYINNSFKNALGIEDENNLDFTNFHTPEQEQYFKKSLLPQILKFGIWNDEFSFKSKSNNIISVIAEWILHRDEEGNPKEISVTAINVTETKKQDAELKKLAGIIENTQAYVLIIDLNLNILYMNNAAKKRFGIREDEDVTALSGFDFIPDETKDAIKTEEAKLIADGKWVGELNYLTRSGEIFPALEVAILHKDENGNPIYTSITLIDIKEQKKAEKELLHLNSELRELSNHLLSIREKERSQIAKEIHDELAQNLVALSMNVAWLKNTIKDKTKDVENKLNEQLDITETVIKSSRTLFNSLHPTMLDEIGLESAIRWHIKNVLRSTKIQIDIHSNIEDEKFSKDINLGLFRIFQESVTNVLRYSKATKVSIDIYKNESTIEMKIQDNGIGFDIEKVDVNLHHGLLGMRERAYALNGKITIESVIKKGTTIKILIPL